MSRGNKPKAAQSKTGARPKKRMGSKQKTAAKKRFGVKTSGSITRKARNRNRASSQISARPTLKADSGRESGDLQGLGRLAEADSESTRELLEEGNAFEADVVSGIEEAGDKPERPVRTREVPEDDVPEEYLDQ